MDKKSKTPSLILLSGYIFSLGFYFIWCFYFFIGRQYPYNFISLIAAVVFVITVVYLFPFLLISYIKSLQKTWISFSLVSIITLLIFFLIPSANSLIYRISYDNELNLKQDKTIKTIENNEPERKFLVANNIKINNQPEDAKEKMQTEQKCMEEIETKLNNPIQTKNAENRTILELQAKLESERKENDKLRTQLNEIIRKTKSSEEEQKTKGNIVIQPKSNKDFSKIKINSKMVNTELYTKNQEIIFKIQIISSSTRLAINSPQFMGLKNVWEYKDSGLYKYTVGDQKDLKSASALQSEIRKKGFSGAFVVAFNNQKRIPVREAKRLLTVYE